MVKLNVAHGLKDLPLQMPILEVLPVVRDTALPSQLHASASVVGLRYAASPANQSWLAHPTSQPGSAPHRIKKAYKGRCTSMPKTQRSPEHPHPDL